MKKVALLLAVVASCFFVSGCFGGEAKSKEFSKDGFHITLTEDFYEKEIISFTHYYESSSAIVTALKEDFTNLELIGLDKDSTLEEYAEAVATANGSSYDFKMNNAQNYLYFTYNATVSGKKYYYYGVIKKSDDAFWLINFACFDDEKDDYQPKFEKWAATIKID